MSALVVRALERELIVYARTWRGSVFSSLVQPLLFLGSMGLGLGGLVDRQAGTVDGLEYVEFVAPGLLAASAMLTAAGESLWPVLGGVKWQGQFKSMVATAMTPGDVYGGLVLATAVRAAISATAFLAVAAVLGATPSWWTPVALLVPVLLAGAVCAVLAAFAVTREQDASLSLAMRVGVIPLFLFSGTFFPVDQLPEAVEALVWLSPLWHAVEAARHLTTGAPGLATVGHLVVLVAVIAAAVPVGVRCFSRRLTP